MPQLSNERLQNLAKLTGGLAVLMALALFVSGTAIPNESQIGAAVCSGGSCVDDDGTLSIVSNPDAIVSGNASNISWDGSGAPSTPGAVTCFGNGLGCSGNLQATIVPGGSRAPQEIQVFTVAGDPDTYMVVPSFYWDTRVTEVEVYRWLPNQQGGVGCWGGTSACSTPMPGSFTWTESRGTGSKVFTIGSDPNPYLMVGSNYTPASSRLYKWNPTLKCFARSSTSSCGGTPTQSFNTSNTLRYWNDVETYEPSLGEVYLIGGYGLSNTTPNTLNQGVRVFKWLPPPANGGYGCFGKGTTCAANDIVPSQGVGGGPGYNGLSLFKVNGEQYLAVTSGGSIRTFKWIPNLNCFGNGVSTCFAQYQSGFATEGLIKSSNVFSYGSDTYIVVSRGSADSYVYKWIPSGTGCPAAGTGGFGYGTTCGTRLPTALPTGGNGDGSALLQSGGEVYFAGRGPGIGWTVYIMQWTPSLECFGNGTACYPSVKQTLGGGQTLAYKMFTAAGNTFFAGRAGADITTLRLYKASTGPDIPASCAVTWDNGTNSGTFSTLTTSINQSTGPLTANTDYTLSCNTTGSNTVTVPVTVTAPKPDATITPSVATVSEAAGSTNIFTVNLSVASTTNVVLNYMLTGSDATGGTDYIPVLSGTVTVLANQTSATIAIDPTDDTTDEPDEDVVVTLSPSGNYNLGAPSSASILILDNDSATTLPTLTTCLGNTPASASCSLGANPSRVRKNTSTTLSWHVEGITGISCNITATPSISGFSEDSPVGATSWIDTQTVTIPRITRFTLTCTDGVNPPTSAPKTVSTLPTYQEI